MNIPKDCRYTKEHEWVRVEGDVVVVGITDFAQSSLGDIVFVELPKVGQKLTASQPFGSVEAVKAVSDLFSPMGGEVVAVNTAIGDDPTVVNQAPHGDGWMIKAKAANPAELDALLSPADYEALVAGLAGGH
jgi:glycine cleavage system H protein